MLCFAFWGAHLLLFLIFLILHHEEKVWKNRSDHKWRTNEPFVKNCTSSRRRKISSPSLSFSTVSVTSTSSGNHGYVCPATTALWLSDKPSQRTKIFLLLLFFSPNFFLSAVDLHGHHVTLVWAFFFSSVRGGLKDSGAVSEPACSFSCQELHHHCVHRGPTTQQPEPTTLPPPHLQPGGQRGHEDRSHSAQPAGDSSTLSSHHHLNSSLLKKISIQKV